MKTTLLLAFILGTPQLSFAQQNLPVQNAAAAPTVLLDGTEAKFRRANNLHKTRFIEIFLAGRDAKTGSTVAACYNTMFTASDKPTPVDTAPQAMVESLDLEKIKKDYAVAGASLNGPKLWLPDWTEIELGVVRDFNGMKAGWVAQLNMGSKTNIHETEPYRPQTIARKSRLGWNKGTKVLLLDDPTGTTWIMKGFQVGLKPQYTYEQFLKRGADNFKKLPKGWQVRLKDLEQDFIETPEGGVATIMSDEFFNVYDKTGPGMSNYKP